MFWTNDLHSTKRSYSFDSRNMAINNDEKKRYEVDKEVPQINDNSMSKNNKDMLNKEISQKVNKFISVNKAHQFDEVCVCEDCIYSKNLNRYQMLKMDLSKSSSYRVAYNKSHLSKRNLSNSVDLTASSLSNKPQQSHISTKNPFVRIDSSYQNQYPGRGIDKIQKPKPNDQLKFAGPLPQASSYKRQYFAVNAPSQYLQIIKQYPLPPRKFQSGSIYAQSYKGNKLVQNQSAKMNDQLKLGKPLTVKQSTNKSLFNAPNPQTYSLRDKFSPNTQRRIQTPNLSFQYKTINRDEFQKPVQKKNCRSRRMQILHGQMLTSGNNNSFSTIQ